MQFLLAGYKSGNDGEVIVPFDVSISPPQASETQINVNLKVKIPFYAILNNIIRVNVIYLHKSVYVHIFFHPSVIRIRSCTDIHTLLRY